jgi:hypothetical protein
LDLEGNAAPFFRTEKGWLAAPDVGYYLLEGQSNWRLNIDSKDIRLDNAHQETRHD